VDTDTLITMLKEEHLPDIGRVRILSWLDMVQGLMFNHDCGNTMCQDVANPSGFPYPILKTVAGTYEYEITDANLLHSIEINGYSTVCRSIAQLYIMSTDAYKISYLMKFLGEKYTKLNPNPSRFPITYFQTIACKQYPRREIQPAKVIFPEDPGTHTDLYYIDFYMKAIPLTDESIPMSMDSDEWFDTIVKGVTGYAEKVLSGESKNWNEFINIDRKKFWIDANKGNEETPLQIAHREC
jgi:hypothetical protein